MAEVTWIEDFSGANDAWIEKFKSGDFSGDSMDDVLLFYKALADFASLNADFKETIDDTMLQYQEVAQYYEIRDTDVKVVSVINESGFRTGSYTGSWKELQEENGWKNPCQMEMIPEAMKQIMSGNANTDSFFFAGTLTVDGPVKLAVIGREWIASYYENNGIDL
jgi:hypothetical protein